MAMYGDSGRWRLTRGLMACAISCLVVHDGAGALGDVLVSGIVRDPVGNPISGASVRIYVEGFDEPGVVRTHPDGRYRATVSSTRPIVRIEYDHRDWHVRVVEELSALNGDNQVINKYLLKREGPKSFVLIVDQIAVYHRLLVNELFADAWDLSEEEEGQRIARFWARYGDRILAIPHPARSEELGPEQRQVIANLTPVQREVVDYLMEDLLTSCGYWASPAPGPGETEPIPFIDEAPGVAPPAPAGFINLGEPAPAASDPADFAPPAADFEPSAPDFAPPAPDFAPPAPDFAPPAPDFSGDGPGDSFP